jgi:hypothetical protein
MYFNPRFGNFGMLVLPFGLVLFIGALYSTAYLIIETSMMVSSRVHDIWVTGIFPQFYLSNFSWFYLNTSMLTFLIITTVCMTIAAILIGRKMAGADFGVLTIMSYVMLYGFIAPLWLMRAAWGTLRAQESVWDSSHK